MNIVDRIELKIRAWNNTHVRKPDVIYLGALDWHELNAELGEFTRSYKGMEVVSVQRDHWIDIGRHL